VTAARHATSDRRWDRIPSPSWFRAIAWWPPGGRRVASPPGAASRRSSGSSRSSAPRPAALDRSSRSRDRSGLPHRVAADTVGAMPSTTAFRSGTVSVVDYRCAAGPRDAPFVELHHGFSLSYVRSGSFGCRTRGKAFELVAGSILVGHAGDEYMCTHDH